MIEQRFRRDYPGEFVILETRWRNGRKEQIREWIENPIDNQHISGRAAVIGSDLDRYQFDYHRLEKHRGGLLGKKRLQTYTVGAVWKDIKANFCIEIDNQRLSEMIKIEYPANNIVYTTARNCIRYPGEFYLIPFSPKIDILALPLYLAAFDGHQEIFLLGYNKDITSGVKGWENHVDWVFKAYPSTKFYFINTPGNTLEMWRKNPNVDCMTYREWVSFCDV